MASYYVRMCGYCSYVVLVKLGVKPLLSRSSFKNPRRHVTNDEDLKQQIKPKLTRTSLEDNIKDVKIFKISLYKI